jgi:tight adherence protein B
MSPAQIILIVLIFLIVFGVGMIYVRGQEAERRKRLIGVVQGSGALRAQGVKVDEKDQQNKRRAEIAKKLKDNKGGEAQGDGKKRKPGLTDKIAQAGLAISSAKFWMFSVLSMIAFIMLALIFHFSPFVTIMAAVIGLLGFPRFILKKLAANRQKKFLEEFADALEAVVRLLKAGMPVSEAVHMIAREFTGPVGEEMSRIYDKQKIGIPLHEAAQEACRRMPLTEMQMFATGLAIQSQTGSSLSEILLNLARVIRARFRLKRKIKALSSEAVASASIIGALPPLVCFGMYFANPAYIETLFIDPFGQVLLAGAIFWMGLGVIVMKIMINFKI